MAVQAIPGDVILKSQASETGAVVASVESLVAQHLPMVFRIAWSVLRNHHDAEDAVQECFVRVLRFRDRLQEVRNAKTWLARIAWTTALDRRSQRTVISGAGSREELLGEEALAQLADPSVSLDEDVAGREMQNVLDRLIAGLPNDLREPLELSTVRELNSAEIADIMKIPAESVRTRLFRARQILRAKLAAMLEVKKHG